MSAIKTTSCITVIIVCIFRNGLIAQPGNSQAIDDVLRPSAAVTLSGYLGNKLTESIANRIMAQDADRLIEPFKLANRTETHLWQNEFWGKWFTSAVLAYKYQPSPGLKKVLDRSVSALLATQTPDGYIGNYTAAHRLEEWDIWGRKYCMLGLLAYYDITGDKKSLTGAIRLADNLISDLNKKDGVIVTKGNFRGMAASSVLEPICLLYKATHNQKYLDFAKEIVRQWETPEGPQLISKANVNVGARFPKPKNWYSPEQGQKAYEMMSCYEGLTELYRLTGNETYKKAVMDAWENIRDTEINIVGSGASIEMWFGGNVLQDKPITHYQETCVTVTWLKLTGQLLRLTGDAKYADEAERTCYNALLGSMSANGAVWAKYTPLNGQRLPGSEQCGMGLNCCEANGPRGLFNIPAYMVTSRKEGLQVNYFSDGVFTLKSLRGDIVLTQHTAYPKSGTIEMDISLQKPQEMEIYIRIPSWSKNTTLTVNGGIVNDVQAGRYTPIKRSWKTGDKIIVELDMRGRVIEMGTIARSVAIMRGPIVLARDSRFESVGLEAALKPVTDGNGYIDLVEDSTKGDDVYMGFKARFIPESYTESPKGPISITLCDYASAGNGKQPSFYKVWGAQLVNKAGD